MNSWQVRIESCTNYTEPQMELLKSIIKDARFKEEGDKMVMDGYWWGVSSRWVTDQIFNQILDVGLTMRVMATIREKHVSEIKEGTAPAPVNQKCNVIVPGHDLLRISEVQLLEDCCTDLLSGEIRKGWRILAVCVQPDRRRPDYIMGRRDDQ